MIRLGVPEEGNENDQDTLGRKPYSGELIRTARIEYVGKSQSCMVVAGKEAWSLLRPRLGLLLTARRDWGTINDVYGHCESFYGHEPMAWYIRDPESNTAQVWEYPFCAHRICR